MTPLDPSASADRRAWLPCPSCEHGGECAGRTCDRHWQYLLSNRGRVVHLQCPACGHLWQHT
jgi:uncharacterized Zn finger protein